MDKLINKVDSAADSISGLITNTAYLTKELGNLFSSIPGAGVLENAFRGLKNYLGTFSIGNLRTQVDRALGRQGGFPQGVPQDIKNMQANAEKAKMDKEALKRQKELIALQKKAQLAEKNKLALTKAAAVFDTTRISIAAALQATYDKETRLRLEALMAIENEQGDLALKKINELANFQKNADLQKLAGITTIGDAALQELNNRLLNELRVINSSKMAEEDKELAREEAFKKYNAALVAAGGLAEKNSYDERTQIQLTEVARLASLSKTYNASLTLDKIRESEEINMIDRVARAQKAADDARLKALQEYIALLGKIGTGGNTGGLTSSGVGSLIPVSKTLDTVDKMADATKNLKSNVNAFDLFPTLTEDQKLDLGGYSPYMNYGPGYGQNYNIKIETGVGDPEAIARAVEDVLNQSSYRGTSVNRGTGMYIA
jgi:hypothetical protein